MKRTGVGTKAGKTARSLRAALGGICLLIPFAGAPSALAEVPLPRQKPLVEGAEGLAPPVTNAAAILSASDYQLLVKAMTEAERRNWGDALALARRMTNKAGETLLVWRYLQDKDSGASFTTHATFIREYGNWPAIDAIRRNAERALASNMPPQQIVTWFDGRDPISGYGMVKLGLAEIAMGQSQRGRERVIEGWIKGNFDAADETQIYARISSLLTPDAHQKRVDRLIWNSDFAAANRALTWASPQVRSWAEIRMRLRANTRGSDRGLASLAGELRNEAGLLFELSRWQRLSGRTSDAIATMLKARLTPASQFDPERWWDERGYQTREAIEDRRFPDAYALAAGNGMERGGEFADAEFIAGWVSLRFLKRPDDAAVHFERMLKGVTFPISVARAQYWLGRAHEAAGRTDEARAAYTAASTMPETYYGMLAASALNPDAIHTLAWLKPDTSDERAAFEAREDIQAVQMLASLQERELLTSFSKGVADNLATAEEYEMLSALLDRMGWRGLSVRVAKRAMQKLIPVGAYSYPLVTLPRHIADNAAPEPALTLAISRQETEFDTSAVSGAGAMGIMQLIPSTARATARMHGIQYDEARLLSDGDYNTQLGMAHLSDLLSDLRGSYILVAVAYNAGPGRVTQWIDQFGDPRSPRIDPVDWVERIPFSETRNYVQRVIENAQVYRTLLAGGSGPLRIAYDLRRGSGVAGAYRPSDDQSLLAPPRSGAVGGN